MHTVTTPDKKSTGSVAAWPSGLFLEFHRHRRQWAREHPEADSPTQRQVDIYAEIKLFMDAPPPPRKRWMRLKTGYTGQSSATRPHLKQLKTCVSTRDESGTYEPTKNCGERGHPSLMPHVSL